MAIKDQFFTLSEAAKELRVTRQTVYRWIEEKKITTEKIAGVVLIEKNIVKQYKEQRERESFGQLIAGKMLDTIKKKYVKKDTALLKTLPMENGYVVIVIENTDGTMKKVSVGGADIKIHIGRNTNIPLVSSVTLTDIKEEPYIEHETKKDRILKNKEE